MPLTTALELHYCSDDDLLKVCWHDDVPLPQLQDDYRTVLQAARSHGATRWLLDVRRREGLTPEAADWITTQWLPHAAVEMQPATLRLAYCISDARARLISASPVLEPLVRKALAGIHSYEMSMFHDRQEAVDWLLA